MSIDDYPGEGKGASSLLLKNLDDVYPDFCGRDLRTQYPGIRFQNLAIDGASTIDVLHNQLKRIDAPASQPILFTLTAGGNDILSGEEADDIVFRLEKIIGALLKDFPRAQLLLATVYDPSDGTKVIFEDGRLMEREFKALQIVNEAIRDIGKRTQIKTADVYSHFLGHGLLCKDSSNPYYRGEDPSLWYLLTIEPNARGAHEIRRLFWQSLHPENPEIS